MTVGELFKLIITGGMVTPSAKAAPVTRGDHAVAIEETGQNYKNLN